MSTHALKPKTRSDRVQDLTPCTDLTRTQTTLGVR
jgi:hypothetical protein